MSVVCFFIPAFASAQFEQLPTEIVDAFQVTRGQLVELDLDTTPGQVVREPVNINGTDYSFELFPNSIRSPKYILREEVAPGQFVNRVPEAPRTLSGSLIGSKGSRVAGSMLDDGLSAKMVMGDGEVMFIEPLVSKMKAIAGTPQANMHLIYKPTDTVPQPGTCGVPGRGQHLFEAVRQANLRQAELRRQDALRRNARDEAPEIAFGTGPEDLIAEIGIDADFEFFSDFGSVAATNNRMELVLNIVNDQYEDEVDISHMISGAVIRSTANDPYTSSDAGTLLGQFQNEWLTNQGSIQRDVAHLFTGRNLNGGTIGVAFLGTICTTAGFGLVESNFTPAIACVTDLSAHELGHNWNAGHCNCPNNTMNAGLTCSNVFTTASRNSIIAHRNTRPCLSPANIPPENDDFANTFAMGALPASVSGENANATVEAGEQQLTETGNTVWWFFNAPDDGVVTVDTFGSNFDTQLHIFTGSGSVANLQPVANNDDANGTTQSSVSFTVVSGQRYEVRVGGFTNGSSDPADGTVSLNADIVITPPDVLWNQQPIANGVFGLHQDFPSNPDFSVYVVSDVTFTTDVNMDAVTVYFTDQQDGVWASGVNTAVLNVFSAQAGFGNPTNGLTVPVTVEDLGDTVAIRAGGLDMDLIAGDYLIGLTPTGDFNTVGQEFHMATAAVGNESMYQNPGGAFNLPAGTQVGNVSDLAAGLLDTAIMIEGTEGLPEGVLWDQEPDPNGIAIIHQDFLDAPPFSVFVVNDVDFSTDVEIGSISVYFSNTQSSWPGNVTMGTVNIFTAPNGLGDPTSGIVVPIDVTDQGGFLEIEASGLNIPLAAGQYFIGLSPMADSGLVGQEFHLPSDSFLGFASMYRNPSGAFGLPAGTDWGDVDELQPGFPDASMKILAFDSGGGGAVFVSPSALNVFRGNVVSGALAEMLDSDDIRAIYNPGFTLNSLEAPVWLIFDGNISGTPDHNFQVESQAGTPGLTYTMEAFNFTTNVFDVIGTEMESFNTDTVETYALTSDHFDGNGDVRSRLGWRQTGFTINFPWEARIDQVGWDPN